ncbi:MAG TPA: sulfocyanin-like copper-binding protein [Gemmatimonadales bacterium]|nr:sulfocyanin-like copper-binding protein [Gemmatimonadales bacterium]
MKRTTLAAVVGLATTAALPSSACAQGDRAAPVQPIDLSWLQADTATRTATFELIAGLTGLNGALNFDGFRDGGLTLTVPLGWTVVMHFRNHDGMLPHSAEIIPEAHPLPIQPVTPAFPKAFTVRLAEGIPSEGRDDMRFVANSGGSYLIFCGVPGHGAAGMWIRFVVSGSVRTPSLAATPGGAP